MKIIKIILLSIVVLFTTNLQAAAPVWSINPNAYQYNMSVTATAKFNCDESTDPNNMIGAFINGNLAGFANVNTSINGSMYAYVTVYSNVAGGDTVSFKMYDSVNDTLLDSKYITVFQENASVGNAAAPFVQKTDYELEEITIDTDTIFEYNLTGDSVVMFRAENENMEFEIVDFTFINDTTGIDNSYFSFVDSFLVLTQDVDFLNKDFYNIHVEATNSRGCSIDTSLVITVKNTNVAPTGINPNPSDIDENQFGGTLVSQLLPIDVSPNDIHVYEITGDTTNFPDNLFFSIFEDSLFSTTNFDYEIQNIYTLEITITDDLLGSYTDTFIVNINDLVEFTNFIENPAYIDENQYPGSFVSTLTPFAILPTDTHTYVLSGDTVNFPDNNAFYLWNDSVLSNQPFDFEIKNQYTLLFEVTDKFGTVYQDTFTVYINGLVEFTDFVDNPVNFDENQDGGLLISQFVAIGVLPIDTHTYILSEDTINFPDNNSFSIQTDSLMSNWNYDFETQNVYTLQIEVRDKFGTLYLDTFTVNINDRVEFTEFIENPTSFDENQDADLLITTLTPIAILVTDTHTYVLSMDTVNFPDNLAFTLNTDSLISNWNYDFETQNVYTLLIEVRDRFDTMYLDTFVVNINDRVEFTDFEENPVDFDENSGPEILISSLTPIAILATDTHTYVLSMDTVNFPDNNAFWINSDSLVNKYNFDYEMQEVYTLLIEVRDRFDTMYLDTFIVYINDLDEFEYFEEDPIYFDENQAAGTVVSTLISVGNLVGDELIYTLSEDTVNFPDNLAFTITAEELLSAKLYSYEEQIEYNILVEIRNEFGTLYLDSMQVFINDLIEFDDLKATNFISPNEDGVNDYFAIPNPELFIGYTLKIFNDNGNNVFTQEGGYDNSWNGLTTNGEELPSATYYYTLIQKGQEHNKFVGKITILRNSKF